MTRCINCTRCIRYASEIAGVPVIATLGKGINIEIGNYINNNFLSEISGNIIDICPVGALNNKLTFFQTRNWELYDNLNIDLYDSLNQNIIIQTKENKVVKILPAKNNILNMELITDNSRFFYLKIKNGRVKYPTFYFNKLKLWLTCSWKRIFSFILLNMLSNSLKSRKVMVADNYLDYLDLKRLRRTSHILRCKTATITNMLDKFYYFHYEE